MTLREFAEKHLLGYGLWPEESASVVEQFSTSEAGKIMAGRLGDDKEGYPSALLAVFLLTVKAEAVVWLAEHKPAHFALLGLKAK